MKIERRRLLDCILKSFFKISAIISASMIVFILLFIFLRGISVFLPSYPNRVNIIKFFTGMTWRPEKGEYGVLFIIINTFITSFLAILIAFPMSVLTALFIVKIAPKNIAKLFKTAVELLAAIPSIVYGVFASGIIVKLVEKLANMFSYSTYGGRSVLSVSLLLAVMILPTITSLSIVAIKSVDKDLELASLALGASQMETNFYIVLKGAKSGIFAGLTLGLARAFGEATAVSMVAGNRGTGPSFNPFDITRTLTSTMLSGLSETSGVDYDIRYSVGIVLMLTILVSNYAIHRFKKKVGNEDHE